MAPDFIRTSGRAPGRFLRRPCPGREAVAKTALDGAKHLPSAPRFHTLFTNRPED